MIKWKLEGWDIHKTESFSFLLFSYFCPHSANEPLLIHYDKLNQNCWKFSELDIQSVGKCKLQGVFLTFRVSGSANYRVWFAFFLLKNRNYRVYLGLSGCQEVQTTGCGLRFFVKKNREYRVCLGLSGCLGMQTTGCGLHFFVKKLGDTGCGLHFRGVGKCKLQGVVGIFLLKN